MTEIEKLQAQLEEAKKQTESTPINIASAPLTTEPILAFMKRNGYTAFSSAIAKNVNEYPFITFTDEAKEKAEQAAALAANRPIDRNIGHDNIYFGRRSSATLTKGQIVDPKFLSQYGIAITTNGAGEKRLKIVSLASGRTSIAELEKFMAENL